MSEPSPDTSFSSFSPRGGPIAELNAGYECVGSVRVPDLRNVPITGRVQAVIDHPAFQRLRRVRQLGPTHLVYPGAVHTRFEHSLGVYSCVRMYVDALLQNSHFADTATEQDLLTVLAAGLVHDLGHYPFAHSLEALHLKGRDTPRHEEVGARIIRGQIAGLRGQQTVAHLLRTRWQVDPERVIRLCTGRLGDNPSAIDRILRSVLSGAIDADKMDYLERDSHHMGVPYGRHYDRGRLLASLTLNRDNTGIAIISKGKVPAEMFVFSRYTMFSEAYWHHTVRAASAMVENALAAFHSRGSVSEKAFLDILLRYDDDRFLEWLGCQTPAGSATRYLVGGLTDHRRRLYKRITTFSRVYSERRKKQAYQRLYHLDAAELFTLVDRIRARLSAVVGRSLHPADIIIDTPPRDKDSLEAVEVVYPNARGQQYYRLHDLSRVVAGIQDDFAMVVKKIRVFAAPQLAGELADRAQVDEWLVDEILK